MVGIDINVLYEINLLKDKFMFFFFKICIYIILVSVLMGVR